MKRKTETIEKRKTNELSNEELLFTIGSSQISSLKPKVVEFFKLIYFVYDKLLDNFFLGKFDLIKTQVDNSNLHKENIQSLVKKSKDFYQFANINERRVIKQVKTIFEVDDNIYPVDLNLANLEGLLQKHLYYQGNNSLFYRKYFKKNCRAETNNC